MKFYPFLFLLAWLPAVTQVSAQDEPDLSEIPGKVMDGLKARFPDAKVSKVSEEREEESVVYDFEFTVEGMKFEADIREDGSIHNWEKEVALGDLSDPVRKAAETRYPKSIVKEVMQITTVKGGREELEGYEILLMTMANLEQEITVTPEGTILEDSGKEE